MWKRIYKKYSGVLGKKLIIGIKDWKQRSRIFLSWLKNLPKSIRILDCGCGIGIASIILKENGFENIIGVDIERKSIKIASKFFKVYQMDCNNLELKEKFDVVMALNLIEHLDFPENFLKKVRRILHPKGILILSLPNEIWFKKFLLLNGFEILDMKPIGRTPFLLTCQTFMVLARKVKS